VQRNVRPFAIALVFAAPLALAMPANHALGASSTPTKSATNVAGTPAKSARSGWNRCGLVWTPTCRLFPAKTQSNSALRAQARPPLVSTTGQRR
jgi:hypothetical protein